MTHAPVIAAIMKREIIKMCPSDTWGPLRPNPREQADILNKYCGCRPQHENYGDYRDRQQ